MFDTCEDLSILRGKDQLMCKAHKCKCFKDKDNKCAGYFTLTDLNCLASVS